jgi:hypothetical protein
MLELISQLSQYQLLALAAYFNFIAVSFVIWAIVVLLRRPLTWKSLFLQDPP